MDENEQLQDLNREEAEYYVGGVVFVSITMMIGTIGSNYSKTTYFRYFLNGNRRIDLILLVQEHSFLGNNVSQIIHLSQIISQWKSEIYLISLIQFNIIIPGTF
jgi:hypothetical protein